ncbi:MAG: hypothetical protein HY537_09745 [Deltaproteobacteria bacterium]|nr:hypothetical protein [Deltaproteobacteria bacterium]
MDKRNSYFSHLLLCSLLIVCFALTPCARGEDDEEKKSKEGIDLLIEKAPQLWAAAHEILPQPQVNDFFGHWTKQDLDFYNKRTDFLRREFSGGGPIKHPNELNFSHSTNVMGIFGDVYGNMMIRQRLAGQDRLKFMDEDTYVTLNKKGAKPDGLIYHEEDGKLIIDGIFEAKLGTSSWYDRNQASRYLEHWQTNGITVGTGGNSKHYNGKDIYFTSPDSSNGKLAKPLKFVTLKQLEQKTELLGTEPDKGSFRGVYHRFPMAAGQLRGMIRVYIRKLAEGRPLDERSKQRVERKPNEISKAALIDYRGQLNDWVIFNGRFPRSTDPDVGHLLAQYIQKVSGGQAKSFIYDLTDEARLLLAKNGNIPVKHNLFKALMALSPYDTKGNIQSNVITAVQAYVMVYESHRQKQKSDLQKAAELDPVTQHVVVRTKPQSSGSEESVVDSLMTESAGWEGWKNFFHSHNNEPEKLWVLSERQELACADALANVGAKMALPPP